MGLLGWSRRHRILAAFGAGALLTLLVVVAVGYFVLSDQRRSARLLAAALSEALDRQVRIERVTDLGTGRVVMRGVHLPRNGGWPAEIAADRVEATGPLVAAARGEAAPLRLVVTRPTVEVPGGGPGGGLAALAGLGASLEGFLSGPLLLDVTLTAGTARGAGGATEFDLTVRTGGGRGSGELVLRRAGAAALTIALDARLDGKTARLGVSGRGDLAPLGEWLPPARMSALTGQTLDLSLTVDALPTRTLTGTGALRVGDAVAAEGTATLDGGVVHMSLSRAAVDLAFAAGVAGLAWRPTGRAELGDVAATWRPETGGRPTVRAAVRLAALSLPPAALGTEILAEGLVGRVTLGPAGAGLALAGDARATLVRVAGFQAAPAATQYRMTLDAGGAVSRADLTNIDTLLEGAALQGVAGYDGGTRRLDARLAGEDVDAGTLVRRLVPDWLAAEDRVGLSGLRLTVSGLDPSTLGAGEARLDARALRLVRKDGVVSTGRAAARAHLEPRGVRLAVDAERVAGSVPVFTGTIPQLTGSAELARGPDGYGPERAALTTRDAQGRDMIVASLSRAAGPGRLLVSARAPELERLDGLWPALKRQVNGSARLDVELAGPGWTAADGRLALRVPVAEVAGGKVSLRDLEADVPIRRGTEIPGEPPWGTLAIGELIGYGVVARDVTTPARMFHDRLSLNDLTYALYSGEGKGWTEVEPGDAGVMVRGSLTGNRVRIEEFVSAYGIRGGTMTGLLRYKLDYEYRAGRLAMNGRFEIPDGGTVNIELLNRLLAYAESDPTGLVRQAVQNLRAFDYKSAEADVRSAGDDVRVSLSLRGRERFLIVPPKVREINIRNMPLSFLARQFPLPN